MADRTASRPATIRRTLVEAGARIRQALPQGRTLPPDVWRRRHRTMLAILWLHAPGLAIFGLYQGFSVAHSVFEASVIAAFAFLATLPWRGRKVPAALVSAGLLTCSAVLVHMSGGFIEAHFHFFVMVVLLSLYEDWTPFLLAVAYVAVHHGLAGTLDPESVYNHPNAIAEPWKWAAIHGFMIAGAGLASIAAWKLNEEFRGRHRRLAAVVESTDDAILTTTVDGIITSWNEGAVKTYGYAPEEIVGQPATVLAPRDRRDEIDGLLERIRRGDRVKSFETVRLRKDGRPIHVSLTISPLRDHEGQVVGASTIARDITRRKELEDALRQYAEQLETANRKLEESNQTLKDFVAIASHDLRGPLSTILGFVTAIPRTWDSTTDEQKQEFIAAIERAARRIARLVEDLLTVSRIESGQVSVHKEAVNLRHAVQEALGSTADLGNGIRTRIPAAAVHADPDHVERILANYVTNALKYGEPPIEVEAREDDGWVEIRVRDHGRGIPEDFIPRMWEKFARPDDPSDSQKGTGLGLSIVAGLAEANGGTAWYEPNHPRGSCFCLRLPRANGSTREESQVR
ncbi:MAG TPA: PAS domain-containing sensor histidine kinase [Actinomycetota bacterium]|nr:PAS domain-containing sensor histidine kinase [Actinomycetota bacterium]